MLLTILSLALFLSLLANLRSLCRRLECAPRRLPVVLWRYAKWYRRRVWLFDFSGLRWGEGEIIKIKSKVDVEVWVAKHDGGCLGGRVVEPAGWKVCDGFLDRMRPGRFLLR